MISRTSIRAAGLTLCCLALLFTAPVRAQEGELCELDADCGPGFECDLPPRAAIDCPPGTECHQPIQSEGSCEAAPLRCETDGDCPEGLSCQQERGGNDCSTAVPVAPAAGADGEPIPQPASDDDTCGSAEPEDASGGGECVLTLVGCEADADCQSDQICAPIGASAECSDVGSTCAPGEPCEPPESQCTVVDEGGACFPSFVACEVDEECPTRWGCLHFDEVDDGAPPFWDVGTAAGGCLPEGFLLAAREQADVRLADGSELGGSSADSGSSAETKRSDGLAPGSPVAQGGASGDADDGSDGKSGGLCAVSSQSATGDIALILLALTWLRTPSRRRKRQHYEADHLRDHHATR